MSNQGERAEAGQGSLDFGISFDFGTPPPARTPRPARRAEGESTSTQPTALPTARSVAPTPPRFAVLDLDRDTWRLHDSITNETVELGRAQVLAAEFPHALTVVEGCHLRPQSATSVAHPFTATELSEFASNLAANHKHIRTVNNRRTPRIWSEAGIDWDDRPKDRDAEMWCHWLLAKLERLESCKHWPEARERRSPEREPIMRDVNVARQYRAYPKSGYAESFAKRVRQRLWRAYNALPYGERDFRYYARHIFGLGPQRRGWPILDNPYICNAYCVAVDITTDQTRPLSNTQIRHICGFNANGYPNQIRADLHHHLVRRSVHSCTEIQRGFVKIVRALIDVDGAGS